jgi:hypothetical protein
MSSRKSKNRRILLPLVVAAGFAMPIALTAVVIALLWWFDVPTPEEACKKSCALKHMRGQLVSGYTQIQSSKQGGIQHCECRP